ncbi:hypothetical protein PROFUN_06657 [Planoprotostelium fungivorum]|uniref:Uncharacterized protein n=1 Tax=Planoprotostelium fungivorum TaxID=1890364 RepID=A0A2P6MSX8_9EUKA|nr:hypothetical protein PROFUN_06657 [Planoprotostelium fungivorum]
MEEKSTLGWFNKQFSNLKALNCSPQQLQNFGYLISNKNIKTKWRAVPSSIAEGYHLLGMQVVGRRGLRIDDQIYRKSPRLQQIVPRGLCFVFKRETDTLHLISIVYPTSKFFGDDDQDEEVVVVDDDEVQKEVPQGTRLISTEKANGEMFTVTVVGQTADGSWLIVLGSKNNKFLFHLNPKKTTDRQVKSMIKEYSGNADGYPDIDMEAKPGWTYMNVWIEMSEFFLLFLLSRPDAADSFCRRLHEEKWTACGEFESFIHPHLVPLQRGHKTVKFFALTSYNEEGSPRETSGAQRLKDLDWLQETGFETVTRLELSPTTDIMQLRREVWHRDGEEGLVLLVLNPDNGEILRMFKMKTVWYVVYRGLREKIRNMMKRGGLNKPDQMKSEFRKTIQKKLDIFKLHDEDNKRWLAVADSMSDAVTKAYEEGEDKFGDIFRYRYPDLIEKSESSRMKV